MSLQKGPDETSGKGSGSSKKSKIDPFSIFQLPGDLTPSNVIDMAFKHARARNPGYSDERLQIMAQIAVSWTGFTDAGLGMTEVVVGDGSEFIHNPSALDEEKKAMVQIKGWTGVMDLRKVSMGLEAMQATSKKTLDPYTPALVHDLEGNASPCGMYYKNLGDETAFQIVNTIGGLLRKPGFVCNQQEIQANQQQRVHEMQTDKQVSNLTTNAYDAIKKKIDFAKACVPVWYDLMTEIRIRVKIESDTKAKSGTVNDEGVYKPPSNTAPIDPTSYHALITGKTEHVQGQQDLLEKLMLLLRKAMAEHDPAKLINMILNAPKNVEPKAPPVVWKATKTNTCEKREEHLTRLQQNMSCNWGMAFNDVTHLLDRMHALAVYNKQCRDEYNEKAEFMLRHMQNLTASMKSALLPNAVTSELPVYPLSREPVQYQSPEDLMHPDGEGWNFLGTSRLSQPGDFGNFPQLRTASQTELHLQRNTKRQRVQAAGGSARSESQCGSTHD